MLHFIQICGMTGPILVILSIIILALTVLRTSQLFAHRDVPVAGLEHGINAIIFWGAMGALIGILGQFTGIYKALQAIAAATEISPKVCMIGLAESFTSTLFGLTVLTISALIWFTLRSRYRQLVARQSSLEKDV